MKQKIDDHQKKHLFIVVVFLLSFLFEFAEAEYTKQIGELTYTIHDAYGDQYAYMANVIV